jgi:drug/metabolite transporter (DMT)-like permease
MNPLVCIVLSGALGVAGQVILKLGMAALGPLALGPEALPAVVAELALDPLIGLGVVVYTSGTFFWLIALSRLDLSYAYPFASLNYVLILLVSWAALGEQPSPLRLAGVVAICLGVWAMARTPPVTGGIDR